MPKTVFVYRDGKLVPKSEARPLNASAHVIRDQMDPLMHHATGQMVDSKSRFRQMTKEAGCIEIGNEEIKPSAPAPQPIDRHVGEAYRMVRDGYRPSVIPRKDWDHGN